MIALQFTDIKNFMNCLLNTTVFDNFLLAEATIVTYNTFIIDGHIVPSFFSKEELEDSTLFPGEFSSWKDMKSICHNFIKGKKTPVQFKITLLADSAMMNKILNEGNYPDNPVLKAFLLNIRYENNTLSCVTATSFHQFQLDKTPDLLWDNALKNYIRLLQLPFEELL